MKKNILLISVFALIATDIKAANFAVVTSPPVFLNIFILVFAIGCIFGSIKVFDLVKGGYLSKSWKLFVSGFSVLALSQLGYLTHVFEVIEIPSFLVPALMTLTAGLFLYGIFEAKRTLE